MDGWSVTCEYFFEFNFLILIWVQIKSVLERGKNGEELNAVRFRQLSWYIPIFIILFSRRRRMALA